MSIRRYGLAAMVALVGLFVMGSTSMVSGAVSGAVSEVGSDALSEVSAITLANQLSMDDKPFLLDVREPEEYAMGHIKGAVLIPLGALQDHLGEIPKDRPVLVYCRSGNRSSRAIHYLMGQGYTNLTNLSGGMIAWSRQCKGLGKAC